MSVPTFTIKRGDTRRALTVTISADPADVISGVTFNMADSSGTLVVNKVAGFIVRQPDATGTAEIQYRWNTNASELATAGVYNGEFEVTYSDTRHETYPSGGFIQIIVEPDLA